MPRETMNHKGKRPETMRFKHRDYNTCAQPVEGPEHEARIRAHAKRVRKEWKRMSGQNGKTA